MRPRKFAQTRSKIENRLRAFFKARLSSTVSSTLPSRLASCRASQADSKAFALTFVFAFPLCVFFQNTAHASIKPPSQARKLSQENPNLGELTTRRLASSQLSKDHLPQNQCAELIETHSTILGLGSGSTSDSSADRQNIFQHERTLKKAAQQSRTINERLPDYLNEIILNVENRYVEPAGAADILSSLFKREFLLDYEYFVSRFLRLPKTVSDHKENGLLMKTAEDYATKVGQLNKAVAAINERESSSAQASAQSAGQDSKSWLLRVASKLAPKYFDRVQNNAKAAQKRLASKLDEEADEIIENARAQHEALLIRIEENQEAVKELNYWLERIKQEYLFMGQIAQELMLDRTRRTDAREQDQLDLTWARVQSIRQDLLQKEAELHTLRNSRLTADLSNKDASRMFSEILTIKRFHLEREISHLEITTNANSENALQAPEKNNRLMAREDFKRPLPRGTRIASIFDLQRTLVIGEEVLLASLKTTAMDANTPDYDFFRGNRFTVASKPKSYFITINPLTFATPLIFSPIAQIFRGQLPEPLLSYVRVSHRQFKKKTERYYETQNNVPRQAVAITTTNLFYRGFRVSEVFRGANSIDGQFTIRGFTYWGNILVSHFRETVSGGVTTWHVYSPRELLRQIQNGLLSPHVLNNLSEDISTRPKKEISQEPPQELEAK